MPSDEQLREQFEDFLSSWFDEYDRALLAPKGLSRLKAAFEAGYLSRDAEVQALREALAEVAEGLAFEIVDKHGPIQAHPDAARSFYRAMEPVYRARRLLGGGKTGETE